MAIARRGRIAIQPDHLGEVGNGRVQVAEFLAGSAATQIAHEVGAIEPDGLGQVGDGLRQVALSLVKTGPLQIYVIRWTIGLKTDGIVHIGNGPVQIAFLGTLAATVDIGVDQFWSDLVFRWRVRIKAIPSGAIASRALRVDRAWGDGSRGELLGGDATDPGWAGPCLAGRRSQGRKHCCLWPKPFVEGAYGVAVAGYTYAVGIAN